MREMSTEGLLDDGHYMVIYLSPELVKLENRGKFLWTNEEKHRHSSCEEMEGYPEKLQVRKNIFDYLQKNLDFCLSFRLGSL